MRSAVGDYLAEDVDAERIRASGISEEYVDDMLFTVLASSTFGEFQFHACHAEADLPGRLTPLVLPGPNGSGTTGTTP